MGFLDSFSSAVSNVGSFLSAGLETFSSSPVGQQFLGQVGNLAISKLGTAIGLTPTNVSGSPVSPTAPSPFSRFGPSPIGPLGTPAPPNPLQNISIDQWNKLLAARAQVQGMTGDQKQQALETFLFAVGPDLFQLMFPTISQTFVVGRRAPVGMPPSIPASQPFGRQPGDFSGGTPVAFPVTRNASFPAPSFLPALFGGGSGVVPASLLGSVARQLPGIAGGLGLGAVVEGLTDFGGGGTPMFKPSMSGARAQFFRTTNPATGQDTWFRPAGRPILWSGDLSACKRVNKVARRARRKR